VTAGGVDVHRRLPKGLIDMDMSQKKLVFYVTTLTAGCLSFLAIALTVMMPA
jgi:hypothetical protein